MYNYINQKFKYKISFYQLVSTKIFPLFRNAEKCLLFFTYIILEANTVVSGNGFCLTMPTLNTRWFGPGYRKTEGSEWSCKSLLPVLDIQLSKLAL
jgi:hypothetical protein